MADIRYLPGPATAEWEWQARGACRGQDTERFFHPDNERGPRRLARERAAKAVCAGCPVIAECGAYALRTHEPYGIWGGMTEAEREEILAGRRAAG